MEIDNVVLGVLLRVPLHNFNGGKTAHVESQEVLTTLCQGERGKHVSIIKMPMAFFLSTLVLSKIGGGNRTPDLRFLAIALEN